MKSKVLALTLLTAFVSVICAPAAFAQSAADYPSLLDNPVEIQVNATGTLGATTSLTVNYGGGLNFTPDTNPLVATADQVVEVNFTDNNPGFQVIIVSTENPTVVDPNDATNTIVRSGLITPAEATASVPLHWTVFDTEAQALAYEFENSLFDAGTIQEGTDVGGKIDNRVNFFVVDRNQSDFYTAEVLGFCAVISGVTNQLGTLASAPYDTNDQTAPVDDDTDITTPEQNDGPQRSTIDGQVFMKFGADYHGAPAGTYSTTTLTLDLITL